MDIVSKLLNLNPALRLGAGEEGTPQSFQMLKNHPWIKSAYEKKDEPPPLYQMKVPFPKNFSSVLKNMN